MPYGEAIVDKHSTSEEMSYKFNAKELDEETGLYYYGARYLDPMSAMWLSVDPLFEKYVGMSPYVYCAGNPVKLVDPDGRGWIKNDEDGTVSWNAEAESQETTPKGSSYIGATVEGVDENGNFIYGAQDGKTYDSAPLPEVVVTAKMPEHIRDMQAAAELGIYEGQQAFLEHPITQATVGVLTCFITPEIWAARTFASSAAVTSANLLKPLGLGSTGRAIAANLTEQLAMKEIMSNPTLGKTVMTGMKDSRWLGWNKMQYTHTALNGTKTTIHYVGKFENGVLKAVDDFKFK